LAAKVVLKAFVVWIAILVIAIGNGIFREAVLLDQFTSATAFLMSGLLLSCFIVAIAYLSLPWLGIRESRALILTGLGWLILTLVFEFSFGLAQGMPMSQILEAYTFRDGNIWPLVLMVTAASPWMAGKFRGVSGQHPSANLNYE